MRTDDRGILVKALTEALAVYNKKHPHRTLLTSAPEQEELDIVASGIEQCGVFKAVSGQVLFSAYSGIVLHSPTLAPHLFRKGMDDVEGKKEEAANWLIKILSTRNAHGTFKAAIWGLEVNQDLALTRDAKLIPFNDLPKSFLKTRISHRALAWGQGYSWYSQRFFEKPRAAYVCVVESLPYIRRDNSAFKELERVLEQARELWTVLEITASARPLAFAYWFDYADPDFDLSGIDSDVSWSLPEVSPKIRETVKLSLDTLEPELAQFYALPKEFRNRLLRSANRFVLGQCRRENVDKILDQTLAFEIAVSGKGGGNAPPSWKVSVRTAQMIGGPIDERQGRRENLSALYKLRNKATHGAGLDGEKAKRTIDDAAALYPILFRSLLKHGKMPNWALVEMETVSTG